MKRSVSVFFFGALIGCIIVLFFNQSLLAGEKVEIIGTVNDNFQVVTDDGNIYQISDNEKGVELDHFAGKRIEARGELLEMNGTLVIVVEEFDVIDVVSRLSS